MDKQGTALNESIQLHEILTFKNLCLTKSITMSPLVSDNELKTIMHQEAAVSKRQIEELRELMKRCNITTSKNI